MELRLISNFGAEEKIISDSTNVDQIKQIMDTLDWTKFHQVVLSKNDSNWLEVGGNLNEPGFSVLYEENGNQFVISKSPKSVSQMTEILISYLKGDGRFKKENTFE